LEKIGHYKLGDNRNRLLPETIDASLIIMMLMALIWTLVLVIGQVGIYVFNQA
jgi:hypothetical protein